jgi:hypothetical protein
MSKLHSYAIDEEMNTSSVKKIIKLGCIISQTSAADFMETTALRYHVGF